MRRASKRCLIVFLRRKCETQARISNPIAPIQSKRIHSDWDHLELASKTKQNKVAPAFVYYENYFIGLFQLSANIKPHQRSSKIYILMHKVDLGNRFSSISLVALPHICIFNDTDTPWNCKQIFWAWLKWSHNENMLAMTVNYNQSFPRNHDQLASISFEWKTRETSQLRGVCATKSVSWA